MIHHAPTPAPRSEARFFLARDGELRLRREAAARERRERALLADACRALPPPLVEVLWSAGLRADSLAALDLAPVVAVAWADREVDPAERQAVLVAAKERGAAEGPARALLERWLRRRPPAALLDAWEAHLASALRDRGPHERREEAARLVRAVRRVAAASGGFLGMAKVSRAEAQMIERVERTLG